jgi:hypothetical protein
VGEGVQARELDEELCRLKRAIAALKTAVELPAEQAPASYRRLLAQGGAAAAADAQAGDRPAATWAGARAPLGLTLADHLAHASRGESRVDDADALDAAATRLQQRARQLRHAAHAADSDYVLASAALDVRLACAATAYEDVCDDDARDALAAAAAADAADAAAAQAEELAAAMAAAALAARTQRPPSTPPMRGSVEAPLIPREASSRTALSAADFGKRMRAERARTAAAAPAEVPVRPFRAHPVPRSTREPRFERLMHDAALVREQRRLESMERLRASELPFSFYTRDTLARAAAEQERAAERERLVEAVTQATPRTRLAGAERARAGMLRAATPQATGGRPVGASPSPDARQRSVSAARLRPRPSSAGHVLDRDTSTRELRSRSAAAHVPARAQSPAPLVARPCSTQPGPSQHLLRFEQLAADCAAGAHASRAERNLAARAAQLLDDAAHARVGYAYDGGAASSAAGGQYVEDCWSA